MSFPELLRQCRKQKHMSQAELASLLGVTQQAVGKWESGKSSPDPTTVAKLAEILDTTADYLLGLFDPTAEGQTEERFFGSYVYSLIPVIGTVKAGYGALAYEEDYGKEYARVKDPSSYFYLVVRGDSMEPRIHDGDLALVHRQDTLENGDLGVLIYGDEGEGTLKRSSAATAWCCSPSTRPIRKWSSRARSSTTCTLQAVWWRPRRSGKNAPPAPEKEKPSCMAFFFIPIFGGAPWNRA